jgi:hypothetical protein
MSQRGRKSAEALSVVTTIPGQRPEPPDTLDEDESVEWRAIVERMPTDWFTRETWPVLAELCRHICTSNVVSARLSADRKRLVLKDPELLDKLTKIHEREARAISSLSTRLRLTPQSRYDEKKANTAVQSVPVVKPWELHR